MAKTDDKTDKPERTNMAKEVEEPGRADGKNVTHVAGHGVTEAEPEKAADDKEKAPRPRVVEQKGNPPIVVTAGNVSDVPKDMPPGPVEGREGVQTGFPGTPVLADRPTLAGQVPAPEAGLGRLREPIEKEHPQDPPIGVVDRKLTEVGEAVGIVHGVVSHDLNAEGEHPTNEPILKCPECGNVNIALEEKDRSEAFCPSCGWSSSRGDSDGNPPGKIPGVHETDGSRVKAGEAPKGKLEGALGMDPQEAKEGVFVQDMDRPVTVGHVGDDGERIGQSHVKLPTPDDPAEDGEPEDGIMAGNVRVKEVVREDKDTKAKAKAAKKDGEKKADEDARLKAAEKKTGGDLTTTANHK